MAVARFWYEGNAFSPIPCTFADFDRREWKQGEAALAAAQGTATELGAVADFARTRTDWDVVALRCASALPAGPIDDEVYRTFEGDLLSGLLLGAQSAPWDAVYLSLHGAAITDTRQTPDLDLVRRIRALLPRVPLGASFDLHANLSPELGGLLDMASGYKTYPHIDMRETAGRVLQGLVRIVEQGLKTRVAVHKPGLLLSSFNMRTDAGPMCDLQALAAAHVRDSIIEASIFGGFPYADTDDTGASIVLVSDAAGDPDGRYSDTVMDALSLAMHDRGPEFSVSLPSPRQGIERALGILREQAGMVAVADPGDNPLSGGGCDTPGLFGVLLETPFELDCVFASFADPAAVATAAGVGVGGVCSLALGGRHTLDFGAPIPVQVRVETLTAGVFRNTGPMETGVETQCGGTALLSLVDRPNIRVIITESVAPANDPGFFELHGIDLSHVRLLCVKAKNHFRGAFKERCIAIIDVDAPGPSALDLTLLPFRRAR